MVRSDALAFPRYYMPFYLAVETFRLGIGYVLYQKYPLDEKATEDKVACFGSKTLSKWQTLYGPKKLELLGVVTSILDCAR